MAKSTKTAEVAPKTPKAPKAAPAAPVAAEPKVKSPVFKPQLRILAALAAAKVPLNYAALAAASGVAKSWLAGHAFKACVANKCVSLVDQKLAKVVMPGDGIPKEFEITAAGRKLLEKSAK